MKRKLFKFVLSFIVALSLLVGNTPSMSCFRNYDIQCEFDYGRLSQ